MPRRRAAPLAKSKASWIRGQQENEVRLEQCRDPWSLRRASRRLHLAMAHEYQPRVARHEQVLRRYLAVGVEEQREQRDHQQLVQQQEQQRDRKE